MLERINKFIIDKEVRESEKLGPQVVEALESLRQDGVEEASSHEIIRRIRRIHRPRNVFDQIGNGAIRLTLELLEEDEQIELRRVPRQIGNKIKEHLVYRRLTPNRETA